MKWRPDSWAGRHERGSMVVEFVFLTVLLLVPLLYLVGTLGRLQAGAYAASAAAREAGRAYVTAPDDAGAPARGQVASGLVLDAHGFSSEQTSVVVTCTTQPCLQPDGEVVVDARVDVPIPLIPDFLAGSLPTSITLSANHVEPVDRFRDR